MLNAFIDKPQQPLSRAQLQQATRVHDDISSRSIDSQVLRLRRKKNDSYKASGIRENQMEGEQVTSTLSAYKRSPEIGNSRWYKGILTSQRACAADNNGAFDFAVSSMKRGTEPPPHVHSREDELFYLLSGEMVAYVQRQVFQLAAGDCMFFPRLTPHAFRITPEELRALVLITPGEFLDAIDQMNAPAERLDFPTDVEAMTYANADLTETIKVFKQYGLRFLTADEIRNQKPDYPA